MKIKIRRNEYEITPNDVISFNGKVYQFKTKKTKGYIQIPMTIIKELQKLDKLIFVTKKIENFGVEVSYFKIKED